MTIKENILFKHFLKISIFNAFFLSAKLFVFNNLIHRKSNQMRNYYKNKKYLIITTN